VSALLQLRSPDGETVLPAFEGSVFDAVEQHDVPPGDYRVWVSFGGEPDWTPSLWFEYDGVKLMPKVCRRLGARGGICGGIAGHPGPCR
jgi:hypothetical protein